MTKSPVINTERQSIKKRIIENGMVKIVITNTAPNTNINTYAGICANFIIIAVLAKEIVFHFLYMLTKMQVSGTPFPAMNFWVVSMSRRETNG